MRILKLAGAALVLVAIVSIWIVGDRSRIGELQTLQGPAAETVESPSASTPPVDPNATPEPTGIDTVAPQILSIDLAQSSVDTTASSQLLTATVHITDDLSGLQRALLRFVPAEGGTQVVEFEIVAGHRVSGDRRDGVYVVSAILPKYSVHGRWYLSQTTVTDNANNSDEGYLAGGGGPEPLRVAGMEPIYFVNGEDNGAPPIPIATAVPVIEPSPPEGGAAADATPWANELRLPALGN